MEQEKKRKSSVTPTASASSLASSVPEDLEMVPQIKKKKPVALRGQVESFMKDVNESIAKYSQEILNTMDVNEELKVRREADIRQQLRQIQSDLAQMKNRLESLEKRSKPSSVTIPAAAAISGAAAKPPALKRSAATVLQPTQSTPIPLKKAEIPVISDFDTPYCVKCNEDGHECH